MPTYTTPSWQTVTVRGTYRRVDGTPVSGRITFTVNVRVAAGLDQVIFPKGAQVPVDLDATGSFSVPLPATDDPDISPTGWSYDVTETFTGGGGESYSLELPLALSAIGLNLVTVMPSPTVPASLSSVYRGVPGGLATLDSSGKVPASQLPSSGLSGPSGSDYAWNRVGLKADRLALDLTPLRVGTQFWSIDEGATPKPFFVNAKTDGTKFWDLAGAAGHHAEAHKSTGSDPMASADIGAAPATNIPLSALDSATQALILNAVQAGSGGTSQSSITVHNTVPLAANDTFRSGPISTAGNTQIKVHVVSDQGFTATLDTSADGVTFTPGSPVYTAVLGSGDYTVLAAYSVTTAYVRLSVVCGSAAMSRIVAETVAVSIGETTIGTPA